MAGATNFDKACHRVFDGRNNGTDYLAKDVGVRCGSCGHRLSVYYCEERLFLVECAACGVKALAKANNAKTAAHRTFAHEVTPIDDMGEELEQIRAQLDCATACADRTHRQNQELRDAAALATTPPGGVVEPEWPLVTERLTFDGNFCDIAQCERVPGGSLCENGSCTQRRVWERLKAYEDTGLTPEEVPTAVEMAQIYSIIEENKRYRALNVTVGRIKELAKADREGRVVVLPCKVGGTMLNLTFPENPALMKNMRLEIAYESRCGVIFHMRYDTFADLVEHDRIKPVSGRSAKDGGT